MCRTCPRGCSAPVVKAAGGRTGRAGREGKAFTFVTKDDDKLWAAVKKIVGKDIPELEIEGSSKPAKEEAEESAAPRRETKAKSDRSRDRKEKEPRRSRRGRGDHDIGELEELTVPFGQSDQLPAFLRR